MFQVFMLWVICFNQPAIIVIRKEFRYHKLPELLILILWMIPCSSCRVLNIRLLMPKQFLIFIVTCPGPSCVITKLKSCSSKVLLNLLGFLRPGKLFPMGAYTTTRTGGQGSCVLLWERHLLRLCQSLRLLAEAKPQLYPARPLCLSKWNNDEIRPFIQLSLEAGLQKALQSRKHDEELSITALVCGTSASVEGAAKKVFDVYVHIATYIPSSIGNAAGHLAIVGPGREIAAAKSSEWVRTRQCLEKLRPPSMTELLLSNDGDTILEGTITNFFAVCYQETKEKDEEDISEKSAGSKWIGYEVQTAPVIAGVLPGVIRQLVIEICVDEGIPLREDAPCWSNRQVWKEAFITNSLRLVQHVESIQVPSSWSDLSHAKNWKEVSWKALHLQGPGLVTRQIQKLVLERAMLEGYQFRNVVR